VKELGSGLGWGRKFGTAIVILYSGGMGMGKHTIGHQLHCKSPFRQCWHSCLRQQRWKSGSSVDIELVWFDRASESKLELEGWDIA